MKTTAEHKALTCALMFVLSDLPDAQPDDILIGLSQLDSGDAQMDITVWQALEDYPSDDLANAVEDHAKHILEFGQEHAFDTAKELLRRNPMKLTRDERDSLLLYNNLDTKQVIESIEKIFQKRAERMVESLSTEMMYFTFWSRDCDMCESTIAVKMKGCEVEAYLNEHEESAEGPYGLTRITADEYYDFEPFQRDRVMEAFENGNGTRHII